ncbi:THO complex subunit 1-like isoform X2 [Oncorhynchus nerka]|uniref:THO complex subunit 1-like isoform X2 n=1 Tax=Oncorhynchus nerka TaxID=8023 RepID=UPI0031B87C39
MSRLWKALVDDFLSLIYLSIDGVTEGICSANTAFLLLGDVLDCLPLYQCDVFSFVEENVSTWKSNSFYTAGKNYLLRMCNDLLRRLSKSQNTVFCGRIQLFLARLFPLSKKSGLNLQSQFNLDNITVFNKNEQESTLGQKPTEEEDGMEVEKGEMGNLVHLLHGKQHESLFHLSQCLESSVVFHQHTCCTDPYAGKSCKFDCSLLKQVVIYKIAPCL